MMKSTIALQLRSLWAGFRAMIIITAFVSLVYTGALTAIGQFAFNEKANGSMIEGNSGEAVGSKYIGQSFTDARGVALKRYFQSRPSATLGSDGESSPYNGAASLGSNLGASNADLIKVIKERKAAVAKLEGVSIDDVPADAVTASASGLDYQISTAYAQIQIRRVAEARGLDTAAVRKLVDRYTTHRGLGFIGEPGVNIVELNAALDRADATVH